MAGLLIVRGDEDRVPFSNLAFGFTLGRRAGRLMVKPSPEELREALLEADAFFFYGHGDRHGRLHLGNGRFFTQEDLKWVIDERKKRNLPKLEFAEVRACHSASTAEYVNRWLELSNSIGCFPNVTASAMPPFIHPMHTYRKPIEANPGARGIWSRLARGPRNA